MRNKIIVGVHAIGDQVRYETIQAISKRDQALPWGKNEELLNGKRDRQ